MSTAVILTMFIDLSDWQMFERFTISVLTFLPYWLSCSQITFDNQVHSGRIKINLENDVDINECRDWKVTGVSKFTSSLCFVVVLSWILSEFLSGHVNFCLSAATNIYLTMAFDCIIILTCITSFTLCTRSVISGIRLQLVSDFFFFKAIGMSELKLFFKLIITFFSDTF